MLIINNHGSYKYKTYRVIRSFFTWDINFQSIKHEMVSSKKNIKVMISMAGVVEEVFTSVTTQ